ncbi:MAG: YbjN domain-containing protein [Clostridia bacterium]|nr:YbjN domain-containing protein [Clostridia bacterium]
MLSTTESFIAELEKNGWKYNGLKELEDGKNHVGCGVTGKTTQADFHLFFDADDKSVSIRVFKLFIVPIDKKLQLLELMNKINSEYRWAKFFIGEDEWMNVQLDALISAETAGPNCLNLILRAMNIIDTAYPRFMHEVWAT